MFPGRVHRFVLRLAVKNKRSGWSVIREIQSLSKPSVSGLVDMLNFDRVYTAGEGRGYRGRRESIDLDCLGSILRFVVSSARV